MQRCAYCDFVTYDDKSYLIDGYFKALQTEIAINLSKFSNRKIKSIFFGGGTPSYPDPSYIKGALNEFSFDKDTEITIEANPGTVDRERLVEYREAGINRISFGVQSFDNDMLIIMGRIHDRAVAIRNIMDAKKAAFENISIDLMLGYPMQTEKMFRNSLETTVELGIKHVSCYSLKIEEGTPLDGMIDKGLLSEPDDEEDRRMYKAALGYLQSNGFRQYEISNFAIPGYECEHNIGYWVLDEYIGFGAGAHSYLDGLRYSNETNLGEYIRALKDLRQPLDYTEKITIDESMKEFMILGLRMTKGISIVNFKTKYGIDIYSVYGNKINECIDAGLLIFNDNRLKLTAKGKDFANQVFRKFI